MPAYPVPNRERDLEQILKRSWVALLSNVSWVEMLTINLLTCSVSGCLESVASETLCGPAAPATGSGGGPLGSAVAPAVAGTELDGKAISGMVTRGASAIESGVEHLVSGEVTDESV